MTSSYLGKTVTVTIERPRGSRHPTWGFLYEVDYGFLPGTMSADGEELDAYFLGERTEGSSVTGTCIAVILRPDGDDKLVVVSDGTAMTEAQIREATHFQEKHFDSRILMLSGSDAPNRFSEDGCG